MIEVKLFTFDYIDELQRKVIVHEEIDDYFLDFFPKKDSYPKGSSKIFMPKDFNLKMPEKSNHYDYENSISLYENLQGMNETKASDPRLWTYLTHAIFWEYMHRRWNLENIENVKSRIVDRYHLKYLKLESLVRNGIARLWWFAHLTIDDSRKDKYELTKVLTGKQDIIVGILERTFGSNKNIRIALLEFLSKNPEITDKQDRWRELFKQTNLLGGVKNLPFLNKDEILTNLYKIKSI